MSKKFLFFFASEIIDILDFGIYGTFLISEWMLGIVRKGMKSRVVSHLRSIAYFPLDLILTASGILKENESRNTRM